MRDAAFVAESIFVLAFSAAVGKFYGQALVEISEFAKTGFNGVVIEIGRLEYFGVGHKGHPSTRKIGVADDFKPVLRNAAFVFLTEFLAFLINFDGEPRRKRVND